MPVSNGQLNWALTMGQGSLQQWAFTFTNPGAGTPYDLSAVTGWEYVARVSATDTGTPLFTVSTTSTAAGLITVTTSPSLSQVLLTINPAATNTVTPGEYFHALWANPFSPVTAFSWVSGALIIAGNPQP